MWKREESVRPEMPDAKISSGGLRTPSTAATTQPTGESSRPLGREVVNIGKSVIINGELSGSEDLTIEGKVEGQIELPDHVLTIGPNGQIKALVSAKSVIVMGHVTGNITATDKINIRENGTVEGDINAPTVAISEGARFRGSIDMQRERASRTDQQETVATEAKPKVRASRASESQHVTSGQTSPSVSASTRASR